MNERHFEILKEIIIDFNEYSTDYTKTRCKEIEQVLIDTLDYITNLQEENERYKHYTKTTGIEELMAENERLKAFKDESEYWENQWNYLYKRYYDYKLRNEKAIEYIKECTSENDEDYMFCMELLNILNGDDEEC